jgi:hypothetical protein
VLALVEHWQREALEAQRERDEAREELKRRSEEDAELDDAIGEALSPDAFSGYVSKLEKAERERDEARAERDGARLRSSILSSRVARLREALKNALLWVANIEEREKARAALKESES